MNIHVEFFNKERSLIGFTYEFLRMCEGYDEVNNPKIVEYNTFSFGLLFVLIQFSFKV